MMVKIVGTNNVQCNILYKIFGNEKYISTQQQKQLTHKLLSRLRQVCAHCTPSSPVPAVEQLKNSCPGGHAGTEKETYVFKIDRNSQIVVVRPKKEKLT